MQDTRLLFDWLEPGHGQPIHVDAEKRVHPIRSQIESVKVEIGGSRGTRYYTIMKIREFVFHVRYRDSLETKRDEYKTVSLSPGTGAIQDCMELRAGIIYQ
jgi:hypothetical protein